MNRRILDAEFEYTPQYRKDITSEFRKERARKRREEERARQEARNLDRLAKSLRLVA